MLTPALMALLAVCTTATVNLTQFSSPAHRFIVVESQSFSVGSSAHPLPAWSLNPSNRGVVSVRNASRPSFLPPVVTSRAASHPTRMLRFSPEHVNTTFTPSCCSSSRRNAVAAPRPAFRNSSFAPLWSQVQRLASTLSNSDTSPAPGNVSILPRRFLHHVIKLPVLAPTPTCCNAPPHVNTTTTTSSANAFHNEPASLRIEMVPSNTTLVRFAPFQFQAGGAPTLRPIFLGCCSPPTFVASTTALNSTLEKVVIVPMPPFVAGRVPLENASAAAPAASFKAPELPVVFYSANSTAFAKVDTQLFDSVASFIRFPPAMSNDTWIEDATQAVSIASKAAPTVEDAPLFYSTTRGSRAASAPPSFSCAPSFGRRVEMALRAPSVLDAFQHCNATSAKVTPSFGRHVTMTTRAPSVFEAFQHFNTTLAASAPASFSFAPFHFFNATPSTSGRSAPLATRASSPAPRFAWPTPKLPVLTPTTLKLTSMSRAAAATPPAISNTSSAPAEQPVVACEEAVEEEPAVEAAIEDQGIDIAAWAWIAFKSFGTAVCLLLAADRACTFIA